MPCVVCRDLDNTRGDSSPTLMQDLERSAATGDCQSCAVLYTGIFSVYPDTQPEAFYFWRKEDPVTGEWLLWFATSDSDQSAARVYSDSHLIPKQDDECEAIATSFPVTDGEIAEESFEFAQSLIVACVENHTECAQPISRRKGSSGTATRRRPPNPRRPARLLHVGRPGSGRIRLLETGRMDDWAKVQYVCLSHCWGKTQPLTTKKSTLEARKEGIAWGDLPKTFQDAVDFTRRLGLRYLWIDSLCIIQDSNEDWRRESSRMAAIFENCFVCLAATASPDSQGGLYFSKENLGALFNTLSLTDEEETHELCGRGCAPRHPEMTSHYPMMDNAEPELPLLKRGWVFQEMLLAPRIVHFWGHELCFQCMEDYACECGADVRDGLDKAAHAQVLSGPNPLAIQQRWRDMVTWYSRLHLSYPRDKLPALAGMAKQMMRFRSDRYLAGLWRGSLFQDLCWSSTATPSSSSPLDDSHPERSKAGSPPVYIAPTWSWASTSHPVEYAAHMNNFVPDARLIKVEVQNIDRDDPTGEVVVGFLTLSAVWARTNPDDKSWQSEGVHQDPYYLLLGQDESYWYWLVLVRASWGRHLQQEYYQRVDFIRVLATDETEEMVTERRRNFTII